jgi:hypothetical protein
LLVRGLARICLVALFALPWPSAARAQTGEAPVPPDPTEKTETTEKSDPPPAKAKSKKRRPVAPGFEESGAAATEPAEKKKAPPESDEEEEEEEDLEPVDVPDQGTNERLIADINAATGEVTLNELVDEILADVVAEIDRLPLKQISPMAIRHVRLGKNIVRNYAQKLAGSIVSHVHAGTQVKMIDCVECDVMRTKMVGNQWVLTRGLVTTDEVRTVGEKLGVKSFMNVSFGFDPETSVLEMDFKVIRAKDGHILWADTFRADETTPMIMRSSDAPMRRKDRLKDLEMLLEGRPMYGYVATAGFMILPHNDPVDGDIGGATAGYRIYERFGAERRVMFGLDLTGFLNTSRLSGAVISAGSWWIPLRPDFINPELRLGAKAGAFIAGTAGNAAVFQLGAEVLLRYRFGLYAYVLFMTKSEYPPDNGTELGGVGMSTGMSFNW